MKNSEWGAVAYLSQNVTFGKGEEIWINPNSNHITGEAGSSVSALSTATTYSYNTENGKEASTTGNVTGVYDMSGGSWEFVSAYVNNVNSNLNNYASRLLSADKKYKDVYEVSNGNTLITPNAGYYGDSVYEISDTGLGENKSWYNDYSAIPGNDYAIFVRGGSNNSASSGGIFGFRYNNGINSTIDSFRVVLTIL